VFRGGFHRAGEGRRDGRRRSLLRSHAQHENEGGGELCRKTRDRLERHILIPCWCSDFNLGDSERGQQEVEKLVTSILVLCHRMAGTLSR
jgi:hypothetical protein